jgi:hypothetical protein
MRICSGNPESTSAVSVRTETLNVCTAGVIVGGCSGGNRIHGATAPTSDVRLPPITDDVLAARFVDDEYRVREYEISKVRPTEVNHDHRGGRRARVVEIAGLIVGRGDLANRVGQDLHEAGRGFVRQ